MVELTKSKFQGVALSSISLEHDKVIQIGYKRDDEFILIELLKKIDIPVEVRKKEF